MSSPAELARESAENTWFTYDSSIFALCVPSVLGTSGVLLARTAAMISQLKSRFSSMHSEPRFTLDNA